ncbi:UNVERIFIED_ORG: hypothetical protein B2H98_16555 [Clostridium botulinum]|uniref:hypothetical protein n=1 Tax=Clostridium botulinum TaxID=1491 RepID=UPI000597AE97|nr:hypothetical protein [Clostridium botulinum]KIL07442.1 hypothetical protein SR42_14810 [Clostridium botulinum]MBN1058884.1 hypothetical protein [Clostridium botulinum]MBN1065098.1 hypothetical protein [Clostridium botulinum]MBN1071425.1 hypothetical protein [Clostridium botulinum]MBY6824393.1 hypothetical protein [Clostridium botulinum]
MKFVEIYKGIEYGKRIEKFKVDILEDNKELIIIADYEDKYIKLINDNLNGENIATEVSEILNIH